MYVHRRRRRRRRRCQCHVTAILVAFPAAVDNDWQRVRVSRYIIVVAVGFVILCCVVVVVVIINIIIIVVVVFSVISISAVFSVKTPGVVGVGIGKSLCG